MNKYRLSSLRKIQHVLQLNAPQFPYGLTIGSMSQTSRIFPMDPPVKPEKNYGARLLCNVRTAVGQAIGKLGCIVLYNDDKGADK